MSKSRIVDKMMADRNASNLSRNAKYTSVEPEPRHYVQSEMAETSPACVQKLQVPDHLDRLHRVAENLFAAITDLNGRLSQSVLSPCLPQAAVASDNAPRSLVPVAAVIDDVINLLRGAQDVMESIHSRLEV